MSGVIVKKCGCAGNAGNNQAAKYQDQKYGQDMRVLNVSVDNKSASCTVCGKEHKLT